MVFPHVGKRRGLTRQMSTGEQAGTKAAKRRKNAAHGASRGTESETNKPRRGERIVASPWHCDLREIHRSA